VGEEFLSLLRKSSVSGDLKLLSLAGIASCESDQSEVRVGLTVKWLECVELAVWLAAESGGHC